MATLADLKLQARQRADQTDSDFVTDSELTSYINNSYKELYDLLVATYEDYYTLDPVEFTIAQGVNEYDLPSNFYKLRGLDYALSQGSDEWETVEPFVFNERNRYQNAIRHGGTLLSDRSHVRYRIVNNKLKFFPEDNADGTYRIWYTPSATDLAADTDVVDGVNGWEEYIIVDAAIKMMQKEESDTSVLVGQKIQLEERIKSMAMDRDSGRAERISDTRRLRTYYRSYED